MVVGTIGKIKVVIIGASGTLGSKIYEHFSKNEKYKAYGTWCNQLRWGCRKYDITKCDKALFWELTPDIIIHAGGLTNVDYCETNPGETYKVNVKGTENLRACCRFGANPAWTDELTTVLHTSRLVYISTDFVFNGAIGEFAEKYHPMFVSKKKVEEDSKKMDYSENDEPAPINFYGRTKFLSEKLIKNSGLEYLIARVSILYSSNGKNFVNWAIDKLKRGEKFEAIIDHIGTPTLIDDIAVALEKLIEKNKTGIYHVAGFEGLSRYEMALRIADVFGFGKQLIKPVKYLDSKMKDQQAALRPKNTSLSTTKLKNGGILMSNFTEGLLKIEKQIEQRFKEEKKENEGRNISRGTWD